MSTAEVKFMPLLPLTIVLLCLAAVCDSLSVGFYGQTCPSAERLVLSAVADAYATNPGFAAGLIRMHFHDCFVRGCDGSVLLDSTSGNSAEKDSPANNPSLRGFEVIDAAKAAIEAQCPQTVSCADILAFAARDGATLAGNLFYQVQAGRRDGVVSLQSEANSNLPSPLFNAAQLVESFARKNLNDEDMVTLSGSHTIGVSHCASFINRLYNFSDTSDIDPTLDPTYAQLLRSKCPSNSAPTDPRVVPLDALTPNVLDNMYYAGLKANLGLLTSDQALMTSSSLANIVSSNVIYPSTWSSKFAAAMVKMGAIEVLEGTQGEIRRNCRVVNSGNAASSISLGNAMFPPKVATS